MESLTQVARTASDNEFVNYAYLLGSNSPVVQRLLSIISQLERPSWSEVFDDMYDTPQAVWSYMDGLAQDLRSAEEMIADQNKEIERLNNRSVIELLADQEARLITAQKSQRQAEQELEKERARYELVKSKLDTWSILSN